VEPNDIGQFRQIQAQLPDRLKMRIMLCSAGGHIAAGAIYSAVGKTAVYLFGATSNAGIKSRGSYILQWKLIEELKRMGVSVYDLNGINPTENPGTYKFKSDLSGNNGRDVYFLGRFDARGSLISWLCVQCWSVLRWSRRWFKKGGRSGWIAERWLKRAG
jgi:lipid II:glycine glycyltransferase (peptidoglycan interpeptide bridge formation enzyme)